jgi:hypothetical protein
MKGLERIVRLALKHGDNGEGLLEDDRCFALALMERTQG